MDSKTYLTKLIELVVKKKSFESQGKRTKSISREDKIRLASAFWSYITSEIKDEEKFFSHEQFQSHV